MNIRGIIFGSLLACLAVATVAAAVDIKLGVA